MPWPDLGTEYSSYFPGAYDAVGCDVIKRVTLESVDQNSVTKTFRYWLGPLPLLSLSCHCRDSCPGKEIKYIEILYKQNGYDHGFRIGKDKAASIPFPRTEQNCFWPAIHSVLKQNICI